MKKVALKYCGGCDPTYDRVEYYEKIKAKTKDLIEWVTLDAPDFDAVLLISGCERACAEKSLDQGCECRALSIVSNIITPDEAVETLLK
ncbi:MAG: hypothetical protein JRI34_00040 [Deltaproteobacteria bacterium]|nr:hypothetical protein [Deltaproteobacteria bacterium]